MSELPPAGPDERREKPILEVWIVDDEDMIRDIVGKVVEGREPKMKYVGFGKGEVAVKEFERRVASGESIPTAIFMDGSLANENHGYKTGPEIIDKIVALSGGKPPYFIAMTAEEEKAETMQGQGAIGVLMKPFRIVNIRDALDLVVEKQEGAI